MKKGFTLIELLVVIAIIGILAAITFPVFARAKDSAYRSSDMASMNAIRTALQLYRNDQGAYPPALLGYATNYSGQALVPANQVVSALYPKRIDSLQTLRPSYDRQTGSVALNSEISTAVWPNKIGDGTGAFQKYGPSDGPVQRCVVDPNTGTGTVENNYYYRISGYDAALVPDTATTKRNELRYTLFWSAYTVPDDPCNPGTLGSAVDDPRQLGYSDPPDTTVVTWDSYFREYDAGATTPQRIKRDIVLFLGGSARPYDSYEVFSKSWKVAP